MPISSFLNGRYFDPETKRVMGLAFEMTCVSLRLVDRSDPICEIVAENIIALAQDGERDPDELCHRTLRSLDGSLLAPFLDDPKHWRARAEEARAIAEQMSHTPSRQTLLAIAQDYERLAEHAERRAKWLLRPYPAATRVVRDAGSQRQP